MVHRRGLAIVKVIKKQSKYHFETPKRHKGPANYFVHRDLPLNNGFDLFAAHQRVD
jgi:hypothetical protein